MLLGLLPNRFPLSLTDLLGLKGAPPSKVSRRSLSLSSSHASLGFPHFHPDRARIRVPRGGEGDLPGLPERAGCKAGPPPRVPSGIGPTGARRLGLPAQSGKRARQRTGLERLRLWLRSPGLVAGGQRGMDGSGTSTRYHCQSNHCPLSGGRRLRGLSRKCCPTLRPPPDVRFSSAAATPPRPGSRYRRGPERLEGEGEGDGGGAGGAGRLWPEPARGGRGRPVCVCAEAPSPCADGARSPRRPAHTPGRSAVGGRCPCPRRESVALRSPARPRPLDF